MGDDIVEDVLSALKNMAGLPPVAMELHVSPADHRLVVDLSTPATGPAPLSGGVVIHVNADLKPTHWVAVMSDSSVEIRGKSAYAVGLGILGRNSLLRIGTVKAHFFQASQKMQRSLKDTL